VRKIVYSGFLKFLAVILFIAGVVLGALTVTDGIMDFYSEDEFIYGFESDFSQSRYVSHLLDAPENEIFDVYHSFFYKYYDNNGRYAGTETAAAEFMKTAAQEIQLRFEDFYYDDKINYFVQWNGYVITNCGAKTPEELTDDEFYSYVMRDSSGNIERESTHGVHDWIEELGQFDDTSTIIICCSIKPDAVNKYMAAWERQEGIVINTFTQTLGYAAVVLVLLIYLLCVCGKNRDGEYRNMWLDRIFAEIHLAAIAGAGVGAVVLCAVVLDEHLSGHFPKDPVFLTVGAAAALGSLIIITSLLSIIRNIKTGKLIESSIIAWIIRLAFRILKWCVMIPVKFIKWLWRQTKAFWAAMIGMLSKKSGAILITMLLVYTVLIGIFGILMPYNFISLVLGILLFGFACFIVAFRAKDLDEIKKAAREIRNGNVGYKILDVKCSDMQGLAININDIARGLDESVAAKVKAERLKTELITNVSHDLKTPITSIISYTELLAKTEGLPDEARDYVSVIAKKSDRLKKLTQDLFDISKVQSGNEDVVLEKLDASLLINQSLGEYDNEIMGSGLQFCVDAPKELYIAADGRKMSRVVSNLIQNILKYSMKNTRVFISACEKNGNIVMEFKNISAYPLDFSADEITGRFVRGDESRTTEGNGLGLAIAKSYTEICGGAFEIVVDGDMFKAILKLKKYI